MCGVEKTDVHRRKNNRIVGGLPVDKVSIRIHPTLVARL